MPQYIDPNNRRSQPSARRAAIGAAQMFGSLFVSPVTRASVPILKNEGVDEDGRCKHFRKFILEDE